ncbi:class I SAM-dependent methyltransferase [Methanobacterium petrolearium]|uniref:class I SAM-dependent methyltransferase n=1 Tax=Methanobacterium petrolearium TaxID=710190 RepID=UPI001AE6513B|nr:class I SAM-dependent methyltransferase [Methanobacterium petrolearium]MBP1946862.1 ubiquinone/menaquinone biosynthesis C-methylase UbiE [Methanobacterium petrolearium]BDZ70475.1 methyltransferase type 11 [Methanobacterium petrolearium]
MSVETLKIINKDAFRQPLIEYTKKAFYQLPPINTPKILDIGCGTGLPTLELARMSGGEVIGIDIDQDSLDILKEKIEKMGLEKQIETINCSLFDLPFPDESFDMIWSEGSIFIIGFKRGLKEWKPLLKDQGFLVVHDQYHDHAKKLEIIEKCGYKLLNSFLITHQTWKLDFYLPYEKHLKKLDEKYKNNSEVQQTVQKEIDEINAFKEDVESLSSIFYVMKKV